MDRPLRLATADGEITADHRILKKMNTIRITFGPPVLDKTMNAISVGRLVLKNNLSSHWTSGGNAYLIDSHGIRIECESKGFALVLKH